MCCWSLFKKANTDYMGLEIWIFLKKYVEAEMVMEGRKKNINTSS